MTNQEADTRLKGTFSKDKHEILYSECGNLNYNNMKDIFKRGSILIRVKEGGKESKTQKPIKPKEPEKIEEKSEDSIPQLTEQTKDLKLEE